MTGLILTQILPFADPIVLDMFGQFERAIYGTRSLTRTASHRATMTAGHSPVLVMRARICHLVRRFGGATVRHRLTGHRCRGGNPMAVRTAMDDVLEQAVSRAACRGSSRWPPTTSGVIYEGAFGKRARSAATSPMTTDTVFWIASMTKAMTSVAAMQQVEQGKARPGRADRSRHA